MLESQVQCSAILIEVRYIYQNCTYKSGNVSYQYFFVQRLMNLRQYADIYLRMDWYCKEKPNVDQFW